MVAMGLLIAPGFKFQPAAPPEQLKRVPLARLQGRRARLVKLIRGSIREAMAVGMLIVSLTPMSVRRGPNRDIRGRMFPHGPK
jgi:hypothetical protein